MCRERVAEAAQALCVSASLCQTRTLAVSSNGSDLVKVLMETMLPKNPATPMLASYLAFSALLAPGRDMGIDGGPDCADVSGAAKQLVKLGLLHTAVVHLQVLLKETRESLLIKSGLLKDPNAPQVKHTRVSFNMRKGQALSMAEEQALELRLRCVTEAVVVDVIGGLLRQGRVRAPKLRAALVHPPECCETALDAAQPYGMPSILGSES